MLRKSMGKFSKKTAFLFVSPILFGAIGNSTISNAVTLNRTFRSGSGSFSSGLGTTSLTRPSVLSTSDKVLGTIGIGVGVVSIVGTAVGLALTENQYNQTRSAYDDIVDRTYYSFLEEREQSMRDLFNQWGVPMPEKYKNPLKTEEISSGNQVTSGFSLGKGD